MRFTIDRSRWRFGGSGTAGTEESDCPRVQEFGKTRLRNAKGFLCCLGMTLEQCGISPENLLNAAEPSELGEEWSPVRADTLGIFLLPVSGTFAGQFANTDLSDRAMTINDADLPHAERERRLTELFAEEDHELLFVGEYLPGA